MLFLHNRYGTPEFKNLVAADLVEYLRWDHTKACVPFRWVHTEPSVHFMKANKEPSMHYRKVNTEPPMHIRRDNMIILSSKMLGKNLHLSVSQLSHTQTSPSKNFCQDAFS